MTTAPKKKRGRPPRERPGRKAAPEVAVDPSVTLIKKYGNRRLYDTRRSRYVTLEDLQDILARGEDVMVVEETTGEDVTKRVMTQIILQEEEGRHLNLLPLNFLKKLIQYRDETLTDYFQKYLAATMDSFMATQRAVEQRLPGLDAKGAPQFPGLGALGQVMPWMPFAAPWMGGQPPAPGTPPPPGAAPQPPPAPPAAPGLSDEVAELRRRLAELETRYRK